MLGEVVVIDAEPAISCYYEADAYAEGDDAD